jgi:hypothetical protein
VGKTSNRVAPERSQTKEVGPNAVDNKPSEKKGHSWLFWLYIKWFVVRKLFVNSSTLKVFTVSPSISFLEIRES